MAAQPNAIETYSPFPRQAEFHANPAKYRLFGGAAGPGKTMALLWEAIMQSLEVPGSMTLLLRRTFPELEMSLLKEFQKSVPWRAMGARYNDQKHEVTWPNGSFTRFGYLTSENDVYQYQGAEFLFIGFDELTHFTLKQWQYLTTRNRHPGQFATMGGATNPGNIGHAWVNALWGCDGRPKRPAPGMDEPEKYDPAEYSFIQARIADNPVYANDKNYLSTLDKVGKNLRRALLEGLWDQFIGQYFDIFDKDRHVGVRQGSEIVCKADGKVYVVDKWWPKWISFDWGFDHDFAVYWHTTAPDGRHITYREWVDNGLTPGMLGQGIIERSVDRNGANEKIEQFFLDPYCYADRTGQSTIAEQISEITRRGNRLPVPAQASDDRVGGWQLLYSLLDQNEWLIAENCERLIDNLPSLIHDDKKTEDVKKVDGDDPGDSARYGLYSRLGTVETPKDIRAAEKVEGVTDPTTRARILETFYAQEAVKDRPVPVGRRHGTRKKFGF